MLKCGDCQHWSFLDFWEFDFTTLNRECSLDHNTDDGAETDASDCPDYCGPEETEE